MDESADRLNAMLMSHLLMVDLHGEKSLQGSYPQHMSSQCSQPSKERNPDRAWHFLRQLLLLKQLYRPYLLKQHRQIGEQSRQSLTELYAYPIETFL